MAFVPSTDQQDPNAAPQGTPNAPNTPMAAPPQTASGVGAPGSATSGGQGAAAVTSAGREPPVQDLGAYLAANAPQAVQMGQNIANNLTAGATKVSGDINADQAAIDAQVQASNTAPNAALVNEAAANPAQFVENPANVEAFQAQENANYTGPTSFEQTPQAQTLQTEIANAEANAPNISSPESFLQLAAGQETNPTPGMTNLDALLLEGNPAAAAPILNAEAPYTSLPGQLSQAQTAEDAAIQAAQANDLAASGLVAPAFETGPNAVVPAWEKGLQTTLNADTAQAQSYDAALNSLISGENAASPDINAVEHALSAYNQEAGVYGTPPAAGFGATSTLPTIATPNLGFTNPAPAGTPDINSIATPADVAKQAALEQLLGTGFTPFLTNPNEAGTYTAPGAVPTMGSMLNPALNTLGTEATGAENAFTANGALVPAGTPANSIVEGPTGANQGALGFGDIPVGYSAVTKGASATGDSAIASGQAILLGKDPTTGADVYAVPGQVVNQPGTSRSAPTYFPETTQGNTDVLDTTVGHQSQINLLPTEYATEPGQLPALQQAISALQQYLAANGG